MFNSEVCFCMISLFISIGNNTELISVSKYLLRCQCRIIYNFLYFHTMCDHSSAVIIYRYIFFQENTVIVYSISIINDFI